MDVKSYSDKCLLKSLFSFFWAFAMVLCTTIPLFINPYMAVIYSVAFFWLYFLACSVPIILFFYFLANMNIYYKKGKDDCTKTPRWGLFLLISVIFIVAIIVASLFFLSLVMVPAISIPVIGLLILLINAAIICKDGYSKSYH